MGPSPVLIIFIVCWGLEDFKTFPRQCIKRSETTLLLQTFCLQYVVRCSIWYHVDNFINVKDTHGGVLKPATLLKVTLLRGCFSHFLNCTNATKSCNASHMKTILSWIFVVTSYKMIELWKLLNHLNANPKKWSNTPKQFVGNLPTILWGWRLKALSFFLWRVVSYELVAFMKKCSKNILILCEKLVLVLIMIMEIELIHNLQKDSRYIPESLVYTYELWSSFFPNFESKFPVEIKLTWQNRNIRSALLKSSPKVKWLLYTHINTHKPSQIISRKTRV